MSPHLKESRSEGSRSISGPEATSTRSGIERLTFSEGWFDQYLDHSPSHGPSAVGFVHRFGLIGLFEPTVIRSVEIRLREPLAREEAMKGLFWMLSDEKGSKRQTALADVVLTLLELSSDAVEKTALVRVCRRYCDRAVCVDSSL